MNELDAFIELNRRFLVDNWQSAAKNNGGGWGYNRQPFAKNRPISTLPRSEVTVFRKLTYSILTASPYLQGYDSPSELIDQLKAEGFELLEILEFIEGNS